MARPSKTAAIDYTTAQDLTYGLLDRAACPDGVPFVLVRDADKKGLRLRVTKAGGKHWQFETRIKGKLFTRALGEWPTVSIDNAKAEAHRLRGLTETGTDPREIERQQDAAKAAAIAEQAATQAAQAQQATAEALTVGEVWAVYIAERKPHWGDLHYADHIRKAAPGGAPFKRGKGTTKAGPLHDLMALPLRDLTTATIEAWAAKEAKTRPTSARLAWRMLKVFLGWCDEQAAYAGLLPAKNPAKTKKSREALGRVNKKKDVLQREQLGVWFDAVRSIGNPCIAAYLQVMLLTGARPNEIISMRWENVNTQWKGITIRDKINRVTRERTIPLTPYVAHLLSALPRRNQWVFSSGRQLNMSEKNIQRRNAKLAKTAGQLSAVQAQETPASGHITEPNHAHTAACTVAGIEGLTLHGLRRSFKSASEWVDVPNGVRQNIMGHVAKSTDEDYTIRPLDLLRVHHEKIEAWILEQAGIAFDAKTAPGGLLVVVR
jgi:integrase